MQVSQVGFQPPISDHYIYIDVFRAVRGIDKVNVTPPNREYENQDMLDTMDLQ
jgi:hypothetical protein